MYKNSGPRQAVLARLLERGPSTVEELARDTGVVPVTMRTHLAALVEQGLVEAEDERGRIGRPRRRYRLTPEARAGLPNRAAGLLTDLLDGLQTLAGARAVDQLLDLAAARYAARHAGECAGKDLEQRVQAATDLLTREGGLARWEKAGDRYLIRDFNCPYAAAASERESVCRYHAQVLSRLLGGPIALERSLARGDQHCLFATPANPPQAPASVRRLSDGRVAPERKASAQ